MLGYRKETVLLMSKLPTKKNPRLDKDNPKSVSVKLLRLLNKGLHACWLKRVLKELTLSGEIDKNKSLLESKPTSKCLYFANDGKY